MYRERASALVPGTIVWQLTGAGAHRVLSDGSTDLLWDGHCVRIAGPDTAPFVAPPGTGDGVSLDVIDAIVAEVRAGRRVSSTAAGIVGALTASFCGNEANKSTPLPSGSRNAA